MQRQLCKTGPWCKQFEAIDSDLLEGVLAKVVVCFREVLLNQEAGGEELW